MDRLINNQHIINEVKKISHTKFKISKIASEKINPLTGILQVSR